MKMKRNEFLKTMGLASATVISGKAIASEFKGIVDEEARTSSSNQLQANADKIKLGVSSYCYQHAFYTGEMTTEDMLAEANSIGAETIQIIDAITVKDWPYPTAGWVEQWYEWMAKYKLTPSLVDTFVDYTWGGRGEPMTTKESIDTCVEQLKLAKRLGFTVVRPSSKPIGTPWPELWEGIVPYAEELDIKVAPEIHSPIPLKGEFVDTLMGIVAKTGTRHLGFTFDMGDMPFRTYYPLIREESVRAGQITREIALYIEQAKENGESRSRVEARVKRMNPKPGDLEYINRVYYTGSFYTPDQGFAAEKGVGITNTPDDLRPLIPYIYNIHGKFFEMTDDCVETSLDYEGVFKVLVEEGWEGAIDSEYEGQRHLHDQYCIPVDEVGQIRRHHVMMRRLLGRA